jgi:8-oxo-dGTP pyrophosphatase MutT (NUDIX family)
MGILSLNDCIPNDSIEEVMIKPVSVTPITRDREIVVFKNRFGSLYNDQTTGPTGQQGSYLRWIWSQGSVVTVPFSTDAVALCWMYRYPAGATLLEFPRGAINNGETAEGAALRELREEAGLIGFNANRLGRLYPDSGLIGTGSEVIAVSVDRQRVAATSTEPMESIVDGAVWLEPDAMSQAIADGDITCGITIAAWAMFRSKQAHTVVK